MLIVGADPGHGDYDIGMTRDDRKESELSLLLVKRLQAECINAHTIVLVRQDDSYVALADRLKLLTDLGSDVNFTVNLEFNRDRRREFTQEAIGIYYLQDNQDSYNVARLLSSEIWNGLSAIDPKPRSVWAYPGNSYLMRRVPNTFMIRVPHLLTAPNLDDEIKKLCLAIKAALTALESRKNGHSRTR